MQCYVHLLHEGLVIGGMEIYILKHTQQKNKAIFSVFQDSKMLQVSVAALRIWSRLELSYLIQYSCSQIAQKCLTLFWTNPRGHTYL